MYNKIDRQPTNDKGILKDNMLFALGSPGIMCIPSIAAGPGLVLLIALLPVTVFVGAPAVTLIQMGTRKKMPLSDFIHTMNGIQKLDGQGFSALMEQVMPYAKQAKSMASCALFRALEQVESEFEKQYNHAIKEEEKRVLEQRIHEIKQRISGKKEDSTEFEEISLLQEDNSDEKLFCSSSSKVYNYHSLKPSFFETDPKHTPLMFSHIKVDYTLTEKDKLQALQTAKEHRCPVLEAQKNEAQKILIIDFFKEPKNAGKKTQYVFKEALEKIEQSSQYDISYHNN